MKRIGGVYCIYIPASDKMYVGSSCRVGHRISTHKSNLRHNKHDNRHLQYSYNKHGYALFFELEYCDNFPEREQFWIDLLKPEFNMRLVSDSNAGMKFVDEWKREKNRKFKSKDELRRWQKGFLSDLSLKRKEKVSKQVVRMSPVEIKLYSSIAEAEEVTGFSRRKILNLIKGAVLENGDEEIAWCFKDDIEQFFR